MPSGYTSNLYEGKKDSLSVDNFILSVASQIGNLGDFSKVCENGKIEKQNLFPKEEDLKFAKLVKEKSEYIEFLKNMNEEEKQEFYEVETKLSDIVFQKKINKVEKAQQRYDQMLEKIQDWNVSVNVSFVKNACIDILKESRAFDCEAVLKAYNERVVLPVNEWFEEKLKNEQSILEMYVSESIEEKKQYDLQIKLIKELFECLPGGFISDELSDHKDK